MFSVVAASLKISLDFYVRFCNILSIIVTTEKVNERAAVNEFHLTLETVSVSTFFLVQLCTSLTRKFTLNYGINFNKKTVIPVLLDFCVL